MNGNPSSFRFNFMTDTTEETTISKENVIHSNIKTENNYKEAKEHFYNETRSIPDSIEFSDLIIGEAKYSIVKMESTNIEKQSEKLSEIIEYSDLQTGIYEGGFKLWECAIDLILYLKNNKSMFKKENLIQSVMELGCGHGIPAISCFSEGVKNIFFLDYNEEVIELVTIPNVIKNYKKIVEDNTNVLFYSGDWEKVSDMIVSNNQIKSMDLIITAETIYTEELCTKLYKMIRKHLNKPNGIALIAAKKYYFGTAGGVNFFLDLVRSDNYFIYETVMENEDCKSNMRCIIKLTFPK